MGEVVERCNIRCVAYRPHGFGDLVCDENGLIIECRVSRCCRNAASGFYQHDIIVSRRKSMAESVAGPIKISASTAQEKRNVCAQCARNLAQRLIVQIGVPKLRQAEQYCRRIGRSAAEARLGRDVLFDSDVDAER